MVRVGNKVGVRIGDEVLFMKLEPRYFFIDVLTVPPLDQHSPDLSTPQ